MSAALELAAVALAGTIGGAALWVSGRRRRAERATQRIAALAEVARRVDAAIAAVDGTPARVHDQPRTAPPSLGAVPVAAPFGRAALVDAIAAAVDAARKDGSRLAVGLVHGDGELTTTVGERVRTVSGGEVYAVGPWSLALVLPGLGRAGALGVLARAQAACGLEGRAVELEPGEDATELLARLLGPLPED